MVTTNPARKQSHMRALIRSVPAAVLITIVLATILRILLVFQRQYVFPDEDRYDRALDFWQAVAEGEPARASG